MAKAVALVHKETGLTAQAFSGFSWTTFIFGPFPALFRGDFVTFLVYLAIVIALGVLMGPAAFLAVIVVGFCWAFMYNDHHLRALVSKGYVFAESAKQNAEAPAPIDSRPIAPEPAQSAVPAVVDLSSDAYKIHLVRKYKIERNDTLGQFIVGDRLFADLDAALRFADEQENARDAFVWRLGKKIGWIDQPRNTFYRMDQIMVSGTDVRPRPAEEGVEILGGDVDVAIYRAETKQK